MTTALEATNKDFAQMMQKLTWFPVTQTGGAPDLLFDRIGPMAISRYSNVTRARSSAPAAAIEGGGVGVAGGQPYWIFRSIYGCL